jgi:hypothetical protein
MTFGLKISLPDGVSQSLSGTEVRNLAGRNVDLLTGLRITSNAGLSPAHRESTKADEADLLPALQVGGNVAEKAPESIGCLTLIDLSVRRDLGNHFFLGHANLPLT